MLSAARIQINDKRAELEGIVAKMWVHICVPKPVLTMFVLFVRSREQAYQEYLLKTTATEDKMRAVMVAIIEKQKILLVNTSIDLLT